MALVDLWAASRAELENKTVQQMVILAGDSKLRDDGLCSTDFRRFLAQAPSYLLVRYSGECLNTRFDDSGAALQDVINEMGRRIGFEVTNGRYRGVANQIGNDGLWRSDDGHAIVVETKTTDTYQIDLDTIARYRSALIKTQQIDEAASSMLIVVGRQETGGLEAQIRGSRHAWDTRVISVEALANLMLLKENLEGPDVRRKIRQILVPQEYTRLDDIILLAFQTTEDVTLDDDDLETEPPDSTGRSAPSDFHRACIDRIERQQRTQLIRESRTIYVSSDNATTVYCAVSKQHTRSGLITYWYGFHPHQRAQLSDAPSALVAFGCGSEKQVLLMPFQQFDAWVDDLWITRRKDRMYWHVVISYEDGRYLLNRSAGHDKVDLSQYLMTA